MSRFQAIIWNLKWSKTGSGSVTVDSDLFPLFSVSACNKTNVSGMGSGGRVQSRCPVPMQNSLTRFPWIGLASRHIILYFSVQQDVSGRGGVRGPGRSAPATGGQASLYLLAHLLLPLSRQDRGKETHCTSSVNLHTLF